MSALYDYQGNEIIVSSQAETLEPQEDDIPVVSITGVLPTDKSQGELPVKITYKSLTDEFTDYATLKVQGDSSTGYPKKNFTVKLFSDSERTNKDKRTFRDWKKANKFVLKANWIDHSHARNIVNARLWTQIYKSRSDFDSLPSALIGGHIAVDGFPVKVFNNGVYQGIYTWNVPKSALYDLDDKITTQALVQGDGGGYSGALLFRDSTDSNNQWSDETHDTKTVAISNGWDRVLNFVFESSDSDFVANFANYFDKQSIIDQYIFLYVGCIVDNIGKNQTFFTYDAQKWYGGMYDMDGTWGLRPFATGSGWKPYNVAFQSGYSAVAEGGGTTNLLYERVGNLFSSDILARYQELRASVLSEDNINTEFDRFMYAIPPYLYEEDYASTTGGGEFTGIPMHTDDHKLQIRQFVIDRLAYVDSMILTE